MRYRPEIDGLRAVAVVPVILFHAGFGRVSGGFVGVDVFFVISGFLITSILLAEHAEGRFSLRSFYERRARRILPALYVVLAACVPMALATMMPDESADFFRGLVSVVLFVSNFWLLQVTGYFQPAADDNPLLHTWSLAVEEQYYVFFPLLLLFLWRRGPWAMLWGIGLLSVASLALAEVGWRHWPEANFFLLPSRAWELGAGSLAAALAFGRGPRQGRAPLLAELAAAAGLAAILASIFAFDARTPLPGLYALVPVAGAAAIVGCASGTMVGRLLAAPPLRLVGLVSYSAYLWHQPLFAFARIGQAERPGHGEMALLVVVTFVLAALTWRLVEQPFRHPARRRTPLRLAWPSAALIAVAAVLPAALPAAQGPDAAHSVLEEELLVPRDARTAYVLAPYHEAAGRGFAGPSSGRKVLILGDSHALDFWNMARENGAFARDRLALAYVFTECQVVLGDPAAAEFQAPADRAACAGWKGTGGTVAIAREADVVIIVANWRPWAAQRLPTTLASFGFRPGQEVLVVGPKSFRGVNLRRLVGADPAGFAAIRSSQQGMMRAATESLRALVPAAELVDLHVIACGDGWDCPIFTPEGHLVSHDGSHLTREGARWLGSLVFADPRLVRFLPERHAALPSPLSQH